jgi:hypothetical protein
MVIRVRIWVWSKVVCNPRLRHRHICQLGFAVSSGVNIPTRVYEHSKTVKLTHCSGGSQFLTQREYIIHTYAVYPSEMKTTGPSEEQQLCAYVCICVRVRACVCGNAEYLTAPIEQCP